MIRVVIIEDEPKAVQELKQILDSLGEGITVVQALTSIEESVQWFLSNEAPDLIFSDIQLADGLSFDIYEQVQLRSPIIFCTAYDEFMLKAFEANGISYLLKPINYAKVEESIGKYKALRQTFQKNYGDVSQQFNALLHQLRPSYQNALLINVRDKIVPIRLDDVSYFCYHHGVVTVTLFNEQQYFVQESLDDIEMKLNPGKFHRVNRQYIIHRNSVREIERYFTRKLAVRLITNTPELIIVSKVKSTAFLDWLAASGRSEQ